MVGRILTNVMTKDTLMSRRIGFHESATVIYFSLENKNNMVRISLVFGSTLRSHLRA